jgi:hypothetical protein
MAASRKILLAHVFEPQFICLELIVGEEVQERPAKNVCSGEIRPVQKHVPFRGQLGTNSSVIPS